MAKKYVIHPGRIISRTDGQRHFIGFDRLCRLYGLTPSECINEDSLEALDLDGAEVIHLHPRGDGIYKAPRS